MDNLFQGLANAPEAIDHRLLIGIPDGNGYEDFLFCGDGYIFPDDILVVHTGMLNARAQAFRCSQKADILSEAAAIENRIIPQTGIKAEKDYLGSTEKSLHG